LKELKKPNIIDAPAVVKEMPSDLKDLYHRMMNQIQIQKPKSNAELCVRILATALTAYYPLHLQELCVLCSLPRQVASSPQSTARVVRMCGSFLGIRDGTVYIIHQSVKDFMFDEAKDTLFPSGVGAVHHSIYLNSLKGVSQPLLHRDMYGLQTPGFPVEKIKIPDPDPLVSVRCSCIC
jgi:hypothetical protein